MAVRKLVLLLCLVVGLQSFTYSGDKINFRENGLSAAFKKAKKDHKLVFILVMSRYCAVCRRLDNDLKRGGEYSRIFNEKFECVKFYADNSFTLMKAGNWGVTKVPSLVFMNEKHKIVHFAEGYTDMQTFTAEAQKAMDQATEKSLTQSN